VNPSEKGSWKSYADAPLVNRLESNASQDGEYRTYPQRWVQLVIFTLCTMLNQVAWISLQPVAEQIHRFYGHSETVVNTLSIVYQAVYICFTFPSNFIIDEHGCRLAVLIGTVSTTLGMAIKCLINDSFWICAAG